MNILVNEVTGRWQRIPEGETHHLEGDASEYGCGISIRGFTTGEREREREGQSHDLQETYFRRQPKQEPCINNRKYLYFI